MTAHIYLGLVRGPAHECKLRTTAKWLNDNKFPCEFSFTDGRIAEFIVSPRLDDIAHWEHDDFYKYAMELTLHALVKHMTEVSA